MKAVARPRRGAPPKGELSARLTAMLWKVSGLLTPEDAIDVASGIRILSAQPRSA